MMGTDIEDLNAIISQIDEENEEVTAEKLIEKIEFLEE
jgi:hypothetical protein